MCVWRGLVADTCLWIVTWAVLILEKMQTTGAELVFRKVGKSVCGTEEADRHGSPLHLQVSTGAYKRQVHEVPLGKQVTEASVIEKITWASWTR